MSTAFPQLTEIALFKTGSLAYAKDNYNDKKDNNNKKAGQKK